MPVSMSHLKSIIFGYELVVHLAELLCRLDEELLA